jgi:hypothetical protein
MPESLLVGTHLASTPIISGQTIPFSSIFVWYIFVLNLTVGPFKGKKSSFNSIWNLPSSKGEV